jgi:putative NIF3 family GTP cyclohydrolase 1 type 2
MTRRIKSRRTGAIVSTIATIASVVALLISFSSPAVTAGSDGSDGGGGSGGGRRHDAPLTAREVIARIQTHIGVPRRDQTVDAFNAGDPDTVVTGIAVTMMATLDVLQRAAAGGQNLVITHEPLFYNHQGDVSELERERDALYIAKRDFIAAHHLVVWRFHDGWHDRRPDGILAGMVRALGWEAYQQAGAPERFVMPETTLGALASRIKRTLDARTLRIIGDPAMKVTKVGLQPGFTGFTRNRHLLQEEEVQVEVIGEGHEWEIGEYAADAVTAGFRKALIVIGHIPSEQAGMDECVRWMKTFVTETPVVFVPAKQPFTFVN